MQDLLFLSHRIPFPPNKGDKIRSWHALRHLAASNRVHLGCFVDDAEDWQYADRLREICGEACILPLARSTALLRSLPALLGTAPMTLPYYRDRRMSEWVRRMLRRDLAGIYVFSAAMAQYIPSGGAGCRRVMDFVDVDSQKWAEYASRKRGPVRLLYKREALALRRFERQVAAAFDASLFVSDAEAQLFKELVPGNEDKIAAFQNGVDCEYFSPFRDYRNPYGADRRVLCFTGAMGYWANVDAVRWFAEEVLPKVRQRLPETSFWIVGANPGPAVRILEKHPGVVVTGFVDDVRPYLASAAAVVAPLRVARGIQNKVLEGMAMAKPVIASPAAREGIRAEHGRDIIVAESADSFAASAVAALTGAVSSEIGTRAREFVTRCHSWPACLAALEAALDVRQRRDPPAWKAAE